MVSRVLDGTLATAGSLLRLRRLQRTHGGTVAAGGVPLRQRTAVHTVVGALTPSGGLRRAARAVTEAAVGVRGARLSRVGKRAAAAVTARSTVLPASLGRVFGRSGIVMLAARAAGEVRLRVRRPF